VTVSIPAELAPFASCNLKMGRCPIEAMKHEEHKSVQSLISTFCDFPKFIFDRNTANGDHSGYQNDQCIGRLFKNLGKRFETLRFTRFRVYQKMEKVELIAHWPINKSIFRYHRIQYSCHINIGRNQCLKLLNRKRN
jgi:hypothetical protein